MLDLIKVKKDLFLLNTLLGNEKVGHRRQYLWYEYSQYESNSYKSTLKIQTTQFIKVWAKMWTLYEKRYTVANIHMEGCPCNIVMTEYNLCQKK